MTKQKIVKLVRSTDRRSVIRHHLECALEAIDELEPDSALAARVQEVIELLEGAAEEGEG